MIDNIIRDATCRIECGAEGGSGYLISKQKLLTARHCVQGAIDSALLIKTLFSTRSGDVVLSATVSAETADMDAAILDLPQPLEATPLRLSSSLPQEGSEWRGFGFPTGKTQIGHRI